MYREQCQGDDSKKKIKVYIKKNQYQMIKEAGTGTFGKVFEAIDTKTNQKVAIKEVLQDIKYKNRELDVISAVHCNNIIQMKDYYFMENKQLKYLYLVMDFYETNLQAVLKSYRKERKNLEKAKLKIIAFQLFKALYYLKQAKVCHRDLKPSNILIDPQTLELRVCDFGSAKIFNKIQKNVAYICSRYYRAPELIFNYVMYGTEIDVWSGGCILAQLLLRQPLFPGDSALEQLIEIIKVIGTPSVAYQMKYITSCQNELNLPEIPPASWERIFARYKPQPELVDLISKILVYDPAERLTPFQILKHPYFWDLISPENKSVTQKLPYLFVFGDLKTDKNEQQIFQLQNLYLKTKLFKPLPSIEKELDNSSKIQTGGSTPVTSLQNVSNIFSSHCNSKKSIQTCNTLGSKLCIYQRSTIQINN